METPRGLRPRCPSCFEGELTEPRSFNLMFQTYVGAVQNDESRAFLRPETAQGQFLNFKNILDTTRVKVPFGVAQVGNLLERIDVGDEENFRFEHIADSGDDALIEQHVADGGARQRADSTARIGIVERCVKQVGTEPAQFSMADEIA